MEGQSFIGPLNAGLGQDQLTLDQLVRDVETLKRRQFDPRYFDVRPEFVSFNGVFDSFPWDKLGFGRSESVDVVTIYTGEIQHKLSVASSIATTTRTITADYQYVWVEYVYATRAITIPAPSITVPAPTASIFRKWLYQYRFSSGSAILYKIGNMGNIHLT